MAFDVETSSDYLSMKIGDSKHINITIFSEQTDSFNVNVLNPPPWLLLEQNFIEVQGGVPKTIKLHISPKLTTLPGTYQYTLSVRSSNTGTEWTKSVSFSVAKTENLTALEIDDIKVSGPLEPSSTVNIEIKVMNTGTVPIANAEIRGAIKLGNKTLETIEGRVPILYPLKTGNLTKFYQLPVGAESGEYVIDVYVSQANKTLDSKKQSFFVVSKAVVQKTVETEKILLGWSKTVTLKNLGNRKATAYEVQEFIGNEDFFFSGERPSKVENGIYHWYVDLDVGEERILRYQVSYMTLLLLIFIIVGSLIYIFLVLRTVWIKKYLMYKKRIKRGDEFTIGIEVKNRTGKDLTNVLVKDFVPHFFKLKETIGPKPEQIKKKNGMELHWKIDNFRNHEERLFSYKIVPIFTVHGQIALPRAEARYRIGNKGAVNLSRDVLVGVEVKKPKKKS
jgi:hypothetical protein